jgi:hypothetical protein
MSASLDRLKATQELQRIEEALKSIHFVMGLLTTKEESLRKRMDELRISAGQNAANGRGGA